MNTGQFIEKNAHVVLRSRAHGYLFTLHIYSRTRVCVRAHGMARVITGCCAVEDLISQDTLLSSNEMYLSYELFSADV